MLIYKTDAGQFVMSHGSYDLNLGSEILILGGDIMSRSWPNIGDSYGTLVQAFWYTRYLNEQFKTFYWCFNLRSSQNETLKSLQK